MPTKLPIVRNISRMLILTFTMFLIRCHDSINMKTNWRMVITKIAILVFLLLSLPITTVWPAVCSRGLGVTWPCSGHPGAHLPWILPYRKARYKMDFKLRITLQKRPWQSVVSDVTVTWHVGVRAWSEPHPLRFYPLALFLSLSSLVVGL